MKRVLPIAVIVLLGIATLLVFAAIRVQEFKTPAIFSATNSSTSSSQIDKRPPLILRYSTSFKLAVGGVEYNPDIKVAEQDFDLSPDCSSLYYIQGGLQSKIPTIHQYNVVAKTDSALIFPALPNGMPGMLQVSPDGSTLAGLERTLYNEGDRTIGIFLIDLTPEVGAAKLLYPAIVGDEVRDFRWSSDSKSFAIHQKSQDTQHSTLDQYLDIMIETGASTKITEAQWNANYVLPHSRIAHNIFPDPNDLKQYFETVDCPKP